MEMLRDLWKFLMERKAWWLVPIILVLLLVVLLIVIGPAAPGLQPFIYSIF